MVLHFDIYTAHIRSLSTIIRIHLQLCNIRVWKCVYNSWSHFIFGHYLITQTCSLKCRCWKEKNASEKKITSWFHLTAVHKAHTTTIPAECTIGIIIFFLRFFLLSKYFVAESQPKWNKYLSRHQCNTDSNSCCELWRNEIILYSSDHKSIASVFHMGMSIFYSFFSMPSTFLMIECHNAFSFFISFLFLICVSFPFKLVF